MRGLKFAESAAPYNDIHHRNHSYKSNEPVNYPRCSLCTILRAQRFKIRDILPRLLSALQEYIEQANPWNLSIRFTFSCLKSGTSVQIVFSENTKTRAFWKFCQIFQLHALTSFEKFDGQHSVLHDLERGVYVSKTRASNVCGITF